MVVIGILLVFNFIIHLSDSTSVTFTCSCIKGFGRLRRNIQSCAYMNVILVNLETMMTVKPNQTGQPNSYIPD